MLVTICVNISIVFQCYWFVNHIYFLQLAGYHLTVIMLKEIIIFVTSNVVHLATRYVPNSMKSVAIHVQPDATVQFSLISKRKYVMKDVVFYVCLSMEIL